MCIASCSWSRLILGSTPYSNVCDVSMGRWGEEEEEEEDDDADCLPVWDPR